MKARIFQPYLIRVNEDQKRFTDVPELHPIKNNTIVDKTITGFGATYSEISYKLRNSIIVMPNIAIVEAKSIKHQEEFNTIGVWGDVTSYTLKKYLNNGRYPKKILVTPESYKRVKLAITECGGDPFKDYFMLIDESHKLTKDVGYRDRIVEPMDDFFLFEKKAMISATPLLPSDPRFVANNFRFIKVDPQYDYQQPLEVIHVDNIINAVKRYLNDNSPSKCFIFFNSINGVKSLIEKLPALNQAKIYCSRESVDKLRENGFINAHSELKDFSRFNFFTSSFYNGLDIELPIKPHVLLITETKSPQTIIDPLTDAIQILGRFRTGFLKATHIYNTDWKISALEPEDATNWLDAQKRTYEVIDALRIANPQSLKEEFQSNIYVQTLLRLPYRQFLSKETLDHYKVDNYLSDERVKGYYISAKLVENSYRQKGQSALKVTFKNYVLIDKKDYLKVRGGKRYSIDNNRRLATTLNLLKGHEQSDEYKEAIREYSLKLPLMLDAFKKLGFALMEKHEFKKAAIKKELLRADLASRRNIYPVFDAIHGAFSSGYFVDNVRIVAKISAIYHELSITESVKPNTILHFFQCQPHSKKIKGDTKRGYIIGKPKQLGHPDYERS